MPLLHMQVKEILKHASQHCFFTYASSETRMKRTDFSIAHATFRNYGSATHGGQWKTNCATVMYVARGGFCKVSSLWLCVSQFLPMTRQLRYSFCEMCRSAVFSYARTWIISTAKFHHSPVSCIDLGKLKLKRKGQNLSLI